MPDYQLSKIYKLWSPSTNLIYIGSTTQTIAQRLADHLRNYKQFKNGKYNYTTSYKILECEDYKIELIELYPCNNREQLFKKEGEHMKNIDCVNKCIIGKTRKEYRLDNKEKIKKYKDTHKEQIKENYKEYYENNKDKFKEHNKEFYENNKDKMTEYYKKNKEKIKEKSKEYYENNKEKMAEYYKKNREKINKNRKDRKEKTNLLIKINY